MTKQCSRCKETHPVDWYAPSARHKDGLYPFCRICKRQIDKAYRDRNREKRAAYDREYGKEYRKRNRAKVLAAKSRWARENPEKERMRSERRRARKANAPINDLTAAQWREIKAAYKGRCAYCGKQPKTLTKDHIIPLNLGVS